MTKICVTGACGYISSVLIEQLLDEGYEVTAIDNISHGTNSLAHLFHTERLKFVYGDVTNENFMKEFFSSHTFDFILPNAAIVGFPLSEFEPEYTYMVNVKQIRYILEYKNKDAKLIFFNTNSSYGTTKGDKEYTEESPTNPISTYSKTKCQAEDLIVHRRYGNPKGEYIVFRLATVYGLSPRVRVDLMVNHFVWKAVHDKSLVLFERKFFRNFVHVRDVGRAVIYAIEHWNKMKNNIFNLGHPKYNITKMQLAEMIKKEIPDLEIIFREGKKDPDLRNYKISNAKILSKGFKFEYPLDKGIVELIEGYKAMKDTKFCNFEDKG